MLAERGCLGVGLGVLVLALSACGGAPEKVAFENKVFYQYDQLNPAQAAKSLESHYPPLDQNETPPLPEYTGVSVIGGHVNISRPPRLGHPRRQRPGGAPLDRVRVAERVHGGHLRAGGVAARRVARGDGAVRGDGEEVGRGAPWPARAHGDGERAGPRVLREAPRGGGEGPLLNYSNEYLLRGDHRIVLLQIVHHDANLAPMDAELRRVVETLEVN